MRRCRLQLLVFKLALQLLRLGYLPNGLIEVILIDGITVILDGEQTTMPGRQLLSRHALERRDPYASVTTFRRSAPFN